MGGTQIRPIFGGEGTQILPILGGWDAQIWLWKIEKPPPPVMFSDLSLMINIKTDLDASQVLDADSDILNKLQEDDTPRSLDLFKSRLVVVT